MIFFDIENDTPEAPGHLSPQQHIITPPKLRMRALNELVPHTDDTPRHTHDIIPPQQYIVAIFDQLKKNNWKNCTVHQTSNPRPPVGLHTLTAKPTTQHTHYLKLLVIYAAKVKSWKLSIRDNNIYYYNK